MLEFFLASGNLPFSVALLVMLMIAAAEAVGLGVGGAHVDMHADVQAEGPDLLGWLGIGQVPLLIVLVVLLALFSLLGIAIQQLAGSFLGGPLSPWLAAPAAFVAALPLTGIGARGLARILPGDETTAIGLGQLLGRRAEVVIGESRRGFPARAKVRDVHGHTHYVMIEPSDDDLVIAAGETALLVRREGELFFGLPDTHPLYAVAD